jgi:hypothetical protein
MADKYRQANGSWGDGLWYSAASGGSLTGVPADGDTVYLNSKTISLDVSTANLVAIYAGVAANSSGTGRINFTGGANRTINATTILAGTAYLISCTHTAPYILYVNGNVTGGVTNIGPHGIFNQSTGHIIVGNGFIVTGASSGLQGYGIANISSGNITADIVVAGAAGDGIYNSGSGTVTVNRATAGSGSPYHGIHTTNTSSGIVNLVEAVGGGHSTSYGVYNENGTTNVTILTAGSNSTSSPVAIANGKLNILGSIAATTANCVYVTGGAVAVLGSVTGGNATNIRGIRCGTGICIISIVGNVMGGNASGANGVLMGTSTKLAIVGDLTAGGTGTPHAVSNPSSGEINVRGTVNAGSIDSSYSINSNLVLLKNSSNWNTASDWSSGSIPSGSDEVYLNHVVSLNGTISQIALIREFGGKIIPVGNSVINVTIARAMNKTLVFLSGNYSLTINGTLYGGDVLDANGVYFAAGSLTVTTVYGGTISGAYGIRDVCINGTITVISVFSGTVSGAYGMNLNLAMTTITNAFGGITAVAINNSADNLYASGGTIEASQNSAIIGKVRLSGSFYIINSSNTYAASGNMIVLSCNDDSFIILGGYATKFCKQLTTSKVLKGTVHGDRTGTLAPHRVLNNISVIRGI